MEILSAPFDSAFNGAAAVADYWQRVGIGVSAVRQTGRLAQDPEAQASFPGFSLSVQPKDLINLHSSRARLPENNFQVAGLTNLSRYMNPELDVTRTSGPSRSGSGFPC